MAFIRSISGIRATVGVECSPQMVADYASAFAAYLPAGAVVVGRDGRPSGAWMEQIACGALAASGRDVLLLGVAPTPTTQLFAEKEGVAGGVSITASHNPADWNGLKFLNGRGMFLNAAENAEFWRIADERAFSFVASGQGGSVSNVANSAEEHVRAVLALPIFRDVQLLERVRAQRFRVAVDAVNSSGSTFMPKLLEAFGCEVHPIFCDGTGVFPHTPEPLPENLSALCQAVRESGADFGVAVDPDADRLVLIDERGEAVREENTIALATLAALSNQERFGVSGAAKVVINLSTTQAVADVAAQFGATTIRVPVGEINVASAMVESGALIGGEGSGGVILPACHAGRDSLVGAALALALLAERRSADPRQTLSGIVAALPSYAMAKRKKDFAGDARDVLEALRRRFPDAPANADDGLRLEFGSAWLHARASNTEPVMRVIAEAPTEAEANALAEQCLSFIR